MTDILIADIHLIAKQGYKNLLGEVFRSLRFGYAKVRIIASEKERIEDLMAYVGMFSNNKRLSVEKVSTSRGSVKGQISQMEVYLKKKPLNQNRK